MSSKTAAQERCAAWIAALELYAYEEITVQWNRRRTRFEIHARRAHSYGEPAATVDVIETWEEGQDPVAYVQRSLHGAHLKAGKAHAQVLPGDTGSHRVDVGDVRKPVALMIHLHPFGRPNDDRLPLRAAPVPDQWLNQIEEICCQLASGTAPANVRI